MNKITKSMYGLRYFDEIAQNDTVIHKLNPLVKLLASFFYILTAVSFNKYEIVALIPLAIYPSIVFNLGDIKVMPVLKRSLLVLPLIMLVGISNPILDKEAVVIFENMIVSRGILSYISLIIKSTLSVMCGMLLIATTSVDDIAKALGSLHVPKIFIMVFLLTYRYTYVLIEEFSTISTSYFLRAPGQKGIHNNMWGPLLGQLLMRTYDRAQSIYSAMCLRGYQGEYYTAKNIFRINDYVYLILCVVFLLLVRFYNVPVILGNIMTGAF